MTETSEPFSRAKLQDTEEMAERFYAWGAEGLPNWVIAQRLGCHVNTVGTFLRRAPNARAALRRGREEAAAGKWRPGGGAWRAETVWRAANTPSSPQPGETCPVCGQEVHGEDAIVLTRTRLEDARRRFDDLIGRHIAARKRAGEAEGSDDAVSAGAGEGDGSTQT